jgi:hypothetical protein
VVEREHVSADMRPKPYVDSGLSQHRVVYVS